jgi:hypothetical protein
VAPIHPRRGPDHDPIKLNRDHRLAFRASSSSENRFPLFGIMLQETAKAPRHALTMSSGGWLTLRNHILVASVRQLRNACQAVHARRTLRDFEYRLWERQSSCARHTAPTVIKEFFSNARCVFVFRNESIARSGLKASLLPRPVAKLQRSAVRIPSEGSFARSAAGQSRRFKRAPGTSALPRTPDILWHRANGRNGTKHKVAALQPAARGQEPRGLSQLRGRQ